LLRSPHDVAAQAEHITARLLELTKSEDPGIALRAMAQWSKLAEGGLLKPPTTAQHIDRDRLLSDLEGLYRKAFGEAHDGIELPSSTGEAKEEREGPVIDVESDETVISELAPVCAVEEPLSRLPPPSPTDQDTAVESESVEESVTDEEAYAWVLAPIPGHFGAKTRRRIRVRVSL
jgi:hypothetical protein